MRWITPLSLVGMATFYTAAFGFWIGEPVAASIVGGISLAAFIALSELRCPACGLNLGRRDNRPIVFPSLEPAPRDCPGCGRTREDVYPFQRMRAPEA
jgi:hypothetical protein